MIQFHQNKVSMQSLLPSSPDGCLEEDVATLVFTTTEVPTVLQHILQVCLQQQLISPPLESDLQPSFTLFS